MGMTLGRFSLIDYRTITSARSHSLPYEGIGSDDVISLITRQSIELAAALATFPRSWRFTYQSSSVSSLVPLDFPISQL